MTANFVHDTVESSLIIGLYALEHVLGCSVLLRFESGEPLLVLLPFCDQRTKRVERVGFRFAHFNSSVGALFVRQRWCKSPARIASFRRTACCAPWSKILAASPSTRALDRTQ